MVKYLQGLSRHRKRARDGKIWTRIKVDSHVLAGDEQAWQILGRQKQDLNLQFQFQNGLTVLEPQLG